MLGLAGTAMAQKQGGTLRVYERDSPASMSILEEATVSAVLPAMPIFNNLVVFDPDKKQNSLQDVVPDLAESWSWNGDGTRLTFKLRHGVKWHDGQPFTAADVKCTWDLLQGKSTARLRADPRKGWYNNVAEVDPQGDDSVVFVLKRRQPALLTLLASGYSPIYPCHVPPQQMRLHPIGTGPFKFVEYKPNEVIKLARNPDYWKKGRPYLDAIEFPIITNRSTAVLAFVAGKLDMTFPDELTPPLLRDVQKQMPKAVCETRTTNVSANIIVNRDAAPFNNADIRKAMALALDRKSFNQILTEGQGGIGAAMLPPPSGIWGMPEKMLETLPGYGPDIKANRDAARELMKKAGYGPDKHLPIKVSTRNIAVYRDPAVILIDQLKQIYIDGDLDVVDTANWFPKIARKQYQVGLNLTGSAVDDPDQQFYENYACGSSRNYTGYCNKELDKKFDEQSMETDQQKRKQMVWEIDKKLQEDEVRPIIMHNVGGTCWRPEMKGLVLQINSIYNGWRFENVWLDK